MPASEILETMWIRWITVWVAFQNGVVELVPFVDWANKRAETSGDAATTGNLAYRASSIFANPERLQRLDPIQHLADWRPVPLLALHNLLDEWIDVDGQRFFIEALRSRYPDPGLVDFHVYERPTGAPYEHSGFGRFSADAKDRQTEFLARHLDAER